MYLLTIAANEAHGPNWAEIVTAVGAALTGLGVVGVVVTIQEARRDRHVLVLSELARRWAGVDLEEARTAMVNYGADGLHQKIQEWFTTEGADPEVEVLLRIPNFYEDVALLVESGGLKFDLVWRSFAGPAIGSWRYWEKAISAMQARDAGAYIEYANLVERLRLRPMPEPKPPTVEQPPTEGDGEAQEVGQEKPSSDLQSSGSATGCGTGSLLRSLLILAALSAVARLLGRVWYSD